ncbi:hypothetical protein pdam_00010636, partial [Pocillopora damicornis]
KCKQKRTGNESDTTEHMLKEGLKKQQRGFQGYLKHVKSDDSVLAEKEDYLKKNMKIQGTMSQEYALGAEFTKNECPLQCDCTDDFSIVVCRRMEKFPVFSFASNVKTLDLAYGQIKHIDLKDVRAYSNLEKLYVNHNPLDCDHETIHTLKHLRETAGLKSFDGHKIKCPPKLPVMNDGFHNNSLTDFCLFASRESKRQKSSRGDSLSKMEKGAGYEFNTTEHLLKEDSKKQRKKKIGSKGYPEHGTVNKDDSFVAKCVEYLKGKMKKQQRGFEGNRENVKSHNPLLTEDNGLNRAVEEQGSNKKGTENKSDTVKHKLKAGPRKQQRGPQGHAKKVKSDESLLANKEDYLEKKIKTQRSFSQGFINHSPLKCDHVTIRTLKHLRETAGLKSIDGNEIRSTYHGFPHSLLEFFMDE